MTSPVLILTRSEMRALMRPSDYLLAVEEAFLALKQGRAQSPLPMHLDGAGGAFHAKGASLRADRFHVALKLNGNFPGNPGRNGLPTIQGALFLCDGENGSLLAVIDSIEITLRRTAAASALAARYLARRDAEVLCICGCGDQAPAQIEALCEVRAFKKAFVWDVDADKARGFAARMTAASDIDFRAVANLRDASLQGDVIVTCTTAAAPFLARGDVSPGAFIAAVGADSPAKNEIAPDLMASAKVVADLKAQCLVIGDLRAAVAAGAMTAEDVYAELGDLVAGAAPGRENNDDIFIFDSTGIAPQDVASAAAAYERAKEKDAGLAVALNQ